MPKKNVAADLNAELDSGAGEATANETAAPATRPRKLEKDLATQPGKVIIKVLGGSGSELVFDPADLTEDIRLKLIPFGLGHKLGDSAAGREGMDAEEAILKVWEGLKASDWSVRAPAQPKVSLKDVLANVNALPEEQRPQAIALLKELGIKVPGLTD